MERAKILKIAEEYMKINKQLKLDLVGSLARGDEFVNDIDFITTLSLPNGKKFFQTEFKGIPIDIWQVDDREIGKIMRTLSKGELINLHKKLKELGLKLTSKGLKTIETIKGGSTTIQAVLFDKNKWTIKKATKWFKDHNFTLPEGKEVHVTNNFFRFRVLTPNNKKFMYRTKWLSKDEGIKIIIAIPKKK